MYKILLLMLLIMLPFSLLAETETAPEPKEKPQFSEDQMDRLKTAEEKYKDNPEVMKLINNIKEKSGLTEDTAQPAAPAEQAPAFQGSAETADSAYKNRDYETAFKNYQALAAEGDADASMKLGAMYQMGYGTDQDPAAAQAWYKKAAEAGDSRAEAFMRFNEDKDMSDEDRERADEIYNDINKKPGTDKDKTLTNETAQQTGKAIKFSVINQDTDGPLASSAANVITRAEGAEKITPEKISGMQHQQPAGNIEHFKPEKIQKIESN